MRLIGMMIGAGFVVLAPLAAQAEVSVARGAQVAVTGGCHDCHTAGYNESAGQIDPALALKGIALGWQGPWGTSYAKNLRLTAGQMNEDDFLQFARTFKTLPPMPWYNVHAMDEDDIRSLYQYIKSLGEPGEPVPDPLPPGETPKTPYFVAAPPIMPGG